MSLFDSAQFAGHGPIYFPLGGAGTWYEGQVYDFQPLTDPADSTRLLCYVSGMKAPTPSGEQSIGRFHVSASNPFQTWASDGQVLTKGAGGAWDAGGVRMGSLFYDAGTYYLFYSGWDAGFTYEKVGLATSTDGTTFTKYASNPILTPTGQGRTDGDFVSEPAVLKEGSAWTMIYGYRNGASILPGYRYATSSDGLSWTKGGAGDVLTTDPLYGEFHQLVKFGASDYALIYEAGSLTVPYRIKVARATTVTGPYTNWSGNPLIKEEGGGYWDRYHVATPALFQLASGRWVVFYCGSGTYAASDYPTHVYWENTWPGSIAVLSTRMFDGSAYDGPVLYDTGTSSGNITVSVPLATLTLTALAPGVNNGATHIFDSAIFDGPSLYDTGVTSGNVTVLVPLGTLTLTARVPTVIATNNNVINVPLATLTLTGFAPSIVQDGNNFIDIPLAHLTLAGHAPTVRSDGWTEIAASSGVWTVVNASTTTWN